ncbi:MAG TPA: type II secretion system secretin GspD [Bryobacteraceae bacterium]|nr:type II secretion system secretin GspD [Bryobacteraceae bacterium]
MRQFLLCLILTASAAMAQAPVGVPYAPPQAQEAAPAAAPQAPSPAPAQTQPSAPQPQTQPQANATPLSDEAPFELNDASLTEMIRILAKRLKINYILDPAVSGKVTIYTYGEVRAVDEMPLLETILRINGFAMVKVGDLYRIVPVKAVSALPIDPTQNADPKALPDDERMILNLVFLKYANAGEMMKLIQQFLGEGAQISTYDPANLLLIEDNSRNMKRTMELISMFDSDTMAGQRVRLFEVSNSRPSDLVKDLENVFKAYALSDKVASVKFIPVDRVNEVIAVAPNPGIFDQVKTWIGKLDVAVKAPAGSVELHAYRLKYGRAEIVATAIMAVLTGNPMAMVGLAAAAGGGIASGASGYGGGSYGMGGYGMGGYGSAGYGGMGYGGMGYGGGYGGMGNGGYGGMGYGGYGGGYSGGYQPNTAQAGTTGTVPPVMTTVAGSATPVPATSPNQDMTGSYLGLASMGQAGYARGPSVIPNPFDNTILVRCTPQEWVQIQDLLRQIDIAPRQVLIDAKIYELDLGSTYSAGVQTFLDKNTGTAGAHALNAAGGATTGGLGVSEGWMVGHALQLLGQLNLAEAHNAAKVVAAPSIIATDSIPAVMNVGQSVPVLTSQAVVAGVQSSGSNVFANTITQESTGTTMAITARVNSSGVVTMMVDQNVSQPVQAASSSSINSPSFSTRSFSTQLTVQDGDTIAIGGFIQEQDSTQTNGIPVLDRIPGLGALFSSKSLIKARTELIVFLTPRVIYDTNQMLDATDEIESNLKKLQKDIREQ